MMWSSAEGYFIPDKEQKWRYSYFLLHNHIFHTVIVCRTFVFSLHGTNYPDSSERKVKFFSPEFANPADKKTHKT